MKMSSGLLNNKAGDFLLCSVPKNIVYIDNGHKSGKFKFYTLSFSVIITGNEVNGFIDFCLKNKVRFLV